jgi:ATP-dependent Clp protease ATP-binding subunit ClpA
MSTELNPLFSKLNSTCHQTFELASEFCRDHNHYSIEIEHLLLKLLEQSHTDVQVILQHYKISMPKLRKELTRAIEKCRRGSEQTLYLSPSILPLLREAWLIASLQLNHHLIRSGAILLALIDKDKLNCGLTKTLPSLFKISPESLQQELPELVKLSQEASALDDTKILSTQAAVISAKSRLSQYTIDLTEKARHGPLEPLAECQSEILKIIDILTCRHQNNLILIGEPGVGKTTLVESLAMKIANEDVPPALQNVTVRMLDIDAFSADSKSILQSIVHDIKATLSSTILLLDEVHNVMESGDPKIAHLLKQTLLNGELRTIVTITPLGYQKYFETEPALMRRFQTISVAEPSEAVAITQLRCRIAYLEQHHKVRITDNAIRQAVRLSNCYILGRKLPEKAVSVLDTACARVATAQNSKPLLLQNTLERIRHLQEEWFMLQHEQTNGHDHSWRLEQLTNELEHLEHSKIELEERWRTEQDLVNKSHQLEKSLEKIAHFPRLPDGKANGTPWKNKKPKRLSKIDFGLHFQNALLHEEKMDEIVPNSSESEEHEEATNPSQKTSPSARQKSKEARKSDESTQNAPSGLKAGDRGKLAPPFQRERTILEGDKGRSGPPSLWEEDRRRAGNQGISPPPFLSEGDRGRPSYSPLSNGNTALSQENVSLPKEEKTSSLIGQPVLNSDEPSLLQKKSGQLPPAFIRKKRQPTYHEPPTDHNSLLPFVKKEFSNSQTAEPKLETETNVVFLHEKEKPSTKAQVLEIKKPEDTLTELHTLEDEEPVIENESTHSKTPIHGAEGPTWHEISPLNEEMEKTQSIAQKSDNEASKTSTPSIETDEQAKTSTIETDQKVSALQSELHQVKQKLAKIQGHDPMVPAQVDERVIAAVISDWTNIPVNQMLTDEIHTILNLKKKMAINLIGQPRALDIIAQHIQTYRANLDNTHKLCTFLLTGPRGVGKTETAILLTQILYGGEQNLIRLAMSDYQEANAVSYLTGGSPGTLGYSKNGALIEAVQRNPYCVILLEEIEKAHPSFIKFLCQILEEGALKNNDFAVNFKNTLILLTSHVGTDAIMRLCQVPSISPRLEQLQEAINPALLQHFQPDFLSRLVTVPYYLLSDLEIRRVIKLKLARIQQRCREKYRAHLSYDDNVLDRLVKTCTDVDMGAHNVNPILTDTLLPLLSTEILERMASGQGFSQIHLSCDLKGNLHYQFDTAKLLSAEGSPENPPKNEIVRTTPNQYDAIELVEDLGEVLDGLKS